MLPSLCTVQLNLTVPHILVAICCSFCQRNLNIQPQKLNVNQITIPKSFHTDQSQIKKVQRYELSIIQGVDLDDSQIDL